MKAAVVLSLLILVPSGYAANAAQSDSYFDIDVVSVTPRSPDVKPFVLAIFTKEQQQRLAAASMKKDGTGSARR
jgi:hypothetical protein